VARLRLVISVSVLVLTIAAESALAEDTAAAASTTTVTVQGKRNEVGDRIDRRVYDVKTDPDAQSGNAGDVLNKLPSVTVTPAGRVALRGDTNVTVLIDGKYPVNGNNFTQTLSATDIDRIEVITNPSAQYGAEGTSGVINIITKKRHPFGVSGTATTRLSTQGQIGGNASISVTKGEWSVTGRVNGGFFPGTSRSSTTRTYPNASQADSRSRVKSIYGGAQVEVARKVGNHQTLTVDAMVYPNGSTTHNDAVYRSASRAFASHVDAKTHNLYTGGEFIYDDNNDEAGRHFTFDAFLGQSDARNTVLTTDTYTQPAAGSAIYGVAMRQSGPDDDVKADYEHRYATGNVLTSGLEWRRIGNDETDLYTDRGAIAGPHADGSRRDFSGMRDLTAAYFTYQHPLVWGWTVLPGLRAEYERLDIRSQGTRAAPEDVRLYPSLHFSHPLGQGKLKLSYSRRVNRPDVNQYDPAITYYSAVYATQGNPGLKPPETDSYEIGYDYTHDKTSYDATVYYRALENAVSDYAADIGNGVILSRPVNSGHSRSGGAEFTVKRPLSKHWKASINANLYYNSVPLLLAGGVEKARGDVTYSGNTSLEYDPDSGDELQTVFTVTGRQLNAQGYVAATSRLDFTWRHDLTKTVALVVNVQDLLAGMKQETVIDTPDLRGRTFQPANDRLVRIGLTRKFGGPKPKS
jgi:outer membrane receptor for ferrienterochelin and colicin